MKHPDKSEKFYQFLNQIDIFLSNRQRSQINQYVQLISEWSGRINLISHHDQHYIFEKHIIPSVWISTNIIDRESEILDIGSGAGFPGVIISIFRDRVKMVLLESIKKKCLFLKEVIEITGINACVWQDRAEKIISQNQNRFQYITSRAVANLDKLWSWSAPMLVPGGNLYTIKGEAEGDVIEILQQNNLSYRVSKAERHWIENYPALDSKRLMILEKKYGK